jgi:hypothetical protein
MLDPKHNPFFEQLKADIHAGIEHGSGRAARDRRRPRPGYHFLIQKVHFVDSFPVEAPTNGGFFSGDGQF